MRVLHLSCFGYFGVNLLILFKKTGNNYVGELAAAFADGLENNTTLQSLRLYGGFIGECAEGHRLRIYSTSSIIRRRPKRQGSCALRQSFGKEHDAAVAKPVW
jgi:hypothetical protein